MKDIAVTIRRMDSRDVPAVAAIVSSGYLFLAEKQTFSAPQLEGLLTSCCSEEAVRGWTPKWKCSVAEVEGHIVGAAAFAGNRLEELWVLPNQHGAGVGTALFRHVEREMLQDGESVLTTRTTGYATGFYRKMGATVVGFLTCSSGPLVGWALTCLEMPLRNG